MNYFSRIREDGKWDVLEGTPDTPGRIVTCFDTKEDAAAYIVEQDAIFNDLFNRITELDNEEEIVTESNVPDNTLTVTAGTTNTTNGTITVTPLDTNGIPLVAHAELAGPPTDFFTDPKLTELQRWTTITDDGRVYGHSAGKDECHIGYMDRCVTIADIADGLVAGCDWQYSMPGHVVTAEGTKVGTGPIPIKGGHADKDLDWIGALAHYDDPATVVADVVYGRDEFGIWFSGAIRPTATPPMIYALRASGVSLDARGIGMYLRYLTTCCVNTPGLPKADAKIAASGEILSLVAAGGPPEPHPDLCGCKDQTTDILEELDYLHKIVADAGLEDAALEKLAARILTDDDIDTIYDRIVVA